MKALAKKQTFIKRWNIGLKVSLEEEQQIKMAAIKKGMGISEYIKQTILDSLSSQYSSPLAKSK